MTRAAIASITPVHDESRQPVQGRGIGQCFEVAEAVLQQFVAAPPGGIDMQAVSDFAWFVTESTYEEGCATQIAAKTEVKHEEMAIARLRTAWRMARGELNKAVAEIQAGKASTD